MPPSTLTKKRENVLLEHAIEEMLPPDTDPRLVQAAHRQCKHECLLSDECDCSRLETWQVLIISLVTARAQKIARKFRASR